MVGAKQVLLADLASQWKVEVAKHWDVLGPFPIHAREQHFLSPSFPVNLSEPIDYARTWPSSLADGGSVGWTTAQASDGGHLAISFPEVRWASLRATEGWAALQHHTVLRTTLTIYPLSPLESSSSTIEPPRLVAKLQQGSFFTILPTSDEDRDSVVPEWHYGNIYAMEREPPHLVTLPVPPSQTELTTYDVFVSGDYEIRLFGDPTAYQSDVPILSIDFSLKLDNPEEEIVRVASQDVVCDFVDGLSFGNALGIGIRSASAWWTAEHVELLTETDGIRVALLDHITLAPTQTRVLPIQLIQCQPFHGSELHVSIQFRSGENIMKLKVKLPVNQYHPWTSDKFQPVKATYLYMDSMPTAFLAIPPKESNIGEPHPPILGLHGAGLDIFDQPFWAEAIPRQKSSWIILPTGRTPWGLDWHGLSTQDAWQSVDALTTILKRDVTWQSWKLSDNTRVVVVGHSNGGQGTWYTASRYPDRVVAAVPASGYIKSQAYVPLTQSRSAHYIDPSLRAILETSLTPDDNDLFLTNLADTPVLAVHGGLDDNVPVWHSREYISILKSWYPEANASLKEDPGQPHWYSSVISNDEVQEFLHNTLEDPVPVQSKEYTLTVAIPSESGSYRGWRIESLKTTGRLARLTVHEHENFTEVRTTNVRTFSIDMQRLPRGRLIVNGIDWRVPPNIKGGLRFVVDRPSNGLEIEISSGGSSIQPSGRMSTALSSKGTILLVIPHRTWSRSLSIALRLAQALNLYHKLDAEIITDSEAMDRVRHGTIAEVTVVVIGKVSTSFTEWCLGRKQTPFSVEGGSLRLQGRDFSDPSMGAIFLHPHPSDASSTIVFLVASRDSGLERVARLFPIRTGVTVPDWLIIGSHADNQGAAGLLGAGVWGQGWTWNEGMSWLD